MEVRKSSHNPSDDTKNLIMWFVLLVNAFLIAGLTMHYIAVNPVLIKGSLNFDYTKRSPLALLHIPYFPPRRFHLTIWFIVPESRYNFKLGGFEVRLDYLSKNGETLATSWHRCELLFKYTVIGYLKTLLNSVPFFGGFTLETQVLNITLTQRLSKPVSYLSVVLQERGEVWPYAGIPEIHAAYLLLESEFSWFRRMFWIWKIPIFFCISLLSFMLEVMLLGFYT